MQRVNLSLSHILAMQNFTVERRVAEKTFHLVKDGDLLSKVESRFDEELNIGQHPFLIGPRQMRHKSTTLGKGVYPTLKMVKLGRSGGVVKLGLQ